MGSSAGREEVATRTRSVPICELRWTTWKSTGYPARSISTLPGRRLEPMRAWIMATERGMVDLQVLPGVNLNHLSGNMARCIAGQKHHQRRNVFRGSQSLDRAFPQDQIADVRRRIRLSRRLDKARRHKIDVDSMPPQLQRSGLYQTNKAGLGGIVASGAHPSAQPVNGTDANNTPLPPADHARRHGTNVVELAFERDLHHLVPILFAHRGELSTARDAGVANQNVRIAQPLLNFARYSLGPLEVGSIGANCHCAAAELFSLFRYFLGGDRITDKSKSHVGAGGGELADDFGTQPARAAGDQRDASVERRCASPLSGGNDSPPCARR